MQLQLRKPAYHSGTEAIGRLFVRLSNAPATRAMPAPAEVVEEVAQEAFTTITNLTPYEVRLSLELAHSRWLDTKDLPQPEVFDPAEDAWAAAQFTIAPGQEFVVRSLSGKTLFVWHQDQQIPLARGRSGGKRFPWLSLVPTLFQVTADRHYVLSGAPGLYNLRQVPAHSPDRD